MVFFFVTTFAYGPPHVPRVQISGSRIPDARRASFYPGSRILRVSESYTSKQCGGCGVLNETWGSAARGAGGGDEGSARPGDDQTGRRDDQAGRRDDQGRHAAGDAGPCAARQRLVPGPRLADRLSLGGTTGHRGATPTPRTRNTRAARATPTPASPGRNQSISPVGVRSVQ